MKEDLYYKAEDELITAARRLIDENESLKSISFTTRHYDGDYTTFTISKENKEDDAET